MKKLSLLLAFVVLAYSVSAQDSPEKKYTVSPTIEAAGSFNLALYNKSLKKSLNIQRRVLYSGGILLGVDFKQSHGVFLLQTGVVISNNDFLYNYYGEKKFHSLFLNVPVIFGYAYRINDKFSVSASAGLVMKNLLKYDLSVTMSPPVKVQNRNIYGVYAAVGFWYHASPHFVLRVEPFFEYFWKDYVSAVGSNIVENMSAPVIGIRFALKCNLLKMD